MNPEINNLTNSPFMENVLASTKNRMLSQLKTVRRLSIACLVTSLIFYVCLIFVILFWIISAGSADYNSHNNGNYYQDTIVNIYTILAIIMTVVACLLAVSTFALSLSSMIFTCLYNGNLKYLINSKSTTIMICGIFQFLLLPSIMSIVLIVITKQELRQIDLRSIGLNNATDNNLQANYGSL